MSYENFAGDEYEGVVTKVEVMPLREHITDELRLAKWGKYDEEALSKNPDYIVAADAEHLILYVKPSPSSDFVKDFVVGRNPVSRTGYQRSNVKALILANKLPLHSKDWVGLAVRLRDNADGFPELVK